MDKSRLQQPHDSALSQPGEDRPTVLYDGDCALCGREIAHYRRLHGADRLTWIDISRDRALIAAHGLDPAAVMARFHVLDAKGRWHTGAWGFAELWSHLPGYRWLARILRTLHLLPLLDRGYAIFARWRLRHRCADGVCDTGGH